MLEVDSRYSTYVAPTYGADELTNLIAMGWPSVLMTSCYALELSALVYRVVSLTGTPLICM